MTTYGELFRAIETVLGRGAAEDLTHEVIPKPQAQPRRPFDELPRFRRLGAAVQARVRRLNPDGYLPGEIPRGWHIAHTAGHARYSRDVMSPREFVRRFGRAAYDAVPRAMMWRDGHRKGIAGLYALNLPQR